MKLSLKILSPEMQLGLAETIITVAGNRTADVNGESAGTPRGQRSLRAGQSDLAVTRETHQQAVISSQHPESSLENECPGIWWWESEVSVVAMKLGNAGGAKGHQKRMMNQ